MAEEMQKQQKVLMTYIDKQREVLNQQQDTLNHLLANLISSPRPNPCFRYGKDGHFICDCLKFPPGGIHGGNKLPSKMSGKQEDSTTVSPAVEEIDSVSALPKTVSGSLVVLV